MKWTGFIGEADNRFEGNFGDGDDEYITIDGPGHDHYEYNAGHGNDFIKGVDGPGDDTYIFRSSEIIIYIDNFPSDKDELSYALD